ncbi:MAG: hypothetical protein ACXVED_02285 [Bacteroidia bacterium]
MNSIESILLRRIWEAKSIRKEGFVPSGITKRNVIQPHNVGLVFPFWA